MTERKRPNAPEAFPFPWMNTLQGPGIWMTVGNAARTAEPVTRSAARAQLELSSLVGTRVKAWSEIPSTLARCRTPFDLLQAQVAFWQEAGRDYTEATQRVMSSWSSLVASATDAASVDAVEPRDYITFPEPSHEAEDRRHPGQSRRAA
jgi:hypothetical protein